MGYLDGFVPRSFWNWFQVPLEDDELNALHGRLGRFFEIAQVFTWIAGLLNLLAIWDALEGPAYGYGDEEESDRKDPEPAEKEPASESTDEVATKDERIKRTESASAAAEPS